MYDDEGAWPEHHCKVADGALLNETIPKEGDGSYSKCTMYDGDDKNKTTTCDEWQYFGDVGHTIVSEVIKLSHCYFAICASLSVALCNGERRTCLKSRQ